MAVRNGLNERHAHVRDIGRIIECSHDPDDAAGEEQSAGDAGFGDGVRSGSEKLSHDASPSIRTSPGIFPKLGKLTWSSQARSGSYFPPDAACMSAAILRYSFAVKLHRKRM